MGDPPLAVDTAGRVAEEAAGAAAAVGHDVVQVLDVGDHRDRAAVHPGVGEVGAHLL